MSLKPRAFRIFFPITLALLLGATSAIAVPTHKSERDLLLAQRREFFLHRKVDEILNLTSAEKALLIDTYQAVFPNDSKNRQTIEILDVIKMDRSDLEQIVRRQTFRTQEELDAAMDLIDAIEFYLAATLKLRFSMKTEEDIAFYRKYGKSPRPAPSVGAEAAQRPDPRLQDRSIAELNLSQNAMKLLRRIGVETFAEAQELTNEIFQTVQGGTPTLKQEILAALAQAGLDVDTDANSELSGVSSAVGSTEDKPLPEIRGRHALSPATLRRLFEIDVRSLYRLASRTATDFAHEGGFGPVKIAEIRGLLKSVKLKLYANQIERALQTAQPLNLFESVSRLGVSDRLLIGFKAIGIKSVKDLLESASTNSQSNKGQQLSRFLAGSDKRRAAEYQQLLAAVRAARGMDTKGTVTAATATCEQKLKRAP